LSPYYVLGSVTCIVSLNSENNPMRNRKYFYIHLSSEERET
jgi:hypothetical protein